MDAPKPKMVAPKAVSNAPKSKMVAPKKVSNAPKSKRDAPKAVSNAPKPKIKSFNFILFSSGVDIRVLLVIRVLVLKPSKWLDFKPFLCLGQFNFSDSYANTALCLKIFGA